MFFLCFSRERPLLFALPFDNGLVDREAAFKRENGNDAATSCTNLNFSPMISEFTHYAVKTRNFAAIRLQFDDRSSFVALAFPNGLEYRLSLIHI